MEGSQNHFSRPAHQNGPVSAHLQSIGSKHPEPYKLVICLDNRKLQRAHGHVAIRAGCTQTCRPKRWASKSYSAALISLLVVQGAQLRYVFTTVSIPRPSSLSDRLPQESSPSRRSPSSHREDHHSASTIPGFMLQRRWALTTSSVVRTRVAGLRDSRPCRDGIR